MRAIQSTRHPDCLAFARELVDHHMQPQTPSIVRARFDE
jgi:hypothetical protein